LIGEVGAIPPTQAKGAAREEERGGWEGAVRVQLCGFSCAGSAGLAACRREGGLGESASCALRLKMVLGLKCERQFSALLKFKPKKKERAWQQHLI